MKGCTDKDANLDFFVANYPNCKWPKSQPCQTPPSVFPPKKHKICILEIIIWYHLKILVVLHHLQKEWKFSDQRWACNICLLLWTSKMSISTAWPIVQWSFARLMCKWLAEIFLEIGLNTWLEQATSCTFPSDAVLSSWPEQSKQHTWFFRAAPDLSPDQRLPAAHLASSIWSI